MAGWYIVGNNRVGIVPVLAMFFLFYTNPYIG